MQKQIDEIYNIAALTAAGRLLWESVGHEFRAENGETCLVLYVYPGETHVKKFNSLFAYGDIGSIPSYLKEIYPQRPETSIIAETPESPLYNPLLKLQDAVIDSIFRRYATPYAPLESKETVKYLIDLQHSGHIDHDDEAMAAISALLLKDTNITEALHALTVHQRLKLQETLYRYTIETCPDCGHPIPLSDMLEAIQAGLCPACHQRLDTLDKE